MTFEQALGSVRSLFLDSAPVIYYIEGTAKYRPLCDLLFKKISAGDIVAVTSAITVAECLALPMRQGLSSLVSQFRALLDHPQMGYSSIDAVPYKAAALRTQYNLSLADGFQIASAIHAGCSAVVTNDKGMRRVAELKVFVLDDFTSS